MNRLTTLLSCFSFLFSKIPAQECAFQYESNAYIEQYTEGYIQRHLGTWQGRAIVRIPVVVHIVWYNEAENISDAQVHSQIEALNRDFRKLNDVRSLPPRFRDSAVDVEIEFCLAKRDPQGNRTSGITRRKVDSANIGDAFLDLIRRKVYYDKAGRPTAWNTQKYLNIWVCAFSSTYGLASSPTSAVARPNEDGILVNYRVFGTIGNLEEGRKNGRIAVHEVGHYFNLLHIWGNSSSCDDDDDVADTPKQADKYTGCPPFPSLSCSTNNMFVNYMDYTNDDCMGMFTRGQKTRMWALLDGFRSGLKTSNGCFEPNTVLDIERFAKVYPNPAKDAINIEFSPDAFGKNKELALSNSLGQIYFKKTFTTEGGCGIPASEFQNGIYFLSLKIDNQYFVKKILVLN
jgi:hypothetical protein